MSMKGRKKKSSKSNKIKSISEFEPSEPFFFKSKHLEGGIYLCAAFYPKFFSVFNIYRKEYYRDLPLTP